jgi:hypothetical protein
VRKQGREMKEQVILPSSDNPVRMSYLAAFLAVFALPES